MSAASKLRARRDATASNALQMLMLDHYLVLLPAALITISKYAKLYKAEDEEEDSADYFSV